MVASYQSSMFKTNSQLVGYWIYHNLVIFDFDIARLLGSHVRVTRNDASAAPRTSTVSERQVPSNCIVPR